jgi:hypothetical protein
VEAVFRSLKDPGKLAMHPQFHWTDQKLHVHTFMCVTAYLLVRLLSWRARKANAFNGSLRNLLSELSQIRLSRLLDDTGRAGRPRVRRQLEEMSDGLGATWANCSKLCHRSISLKQGVVVYTDCVCKLLHSKNLRHYRCRLMKLALGLMQQAQTGRPWEVQAWNAQKSPVCNARSRFTSR